MPLARVEGCIFNHRQESLKHLTVRLFILSKSKKNNAVITFPTKFCFETLDALLKAHSLNVNQRNFADYNQL